jgi:hypothetical protein
MLGFRRHLQAASIAHGCKTTLKRLHEIRSHGEQKTWADAWGLRADRLDTWSDTPEAPEKAGGCWYRAGCDCPFSKQALASSGLKAATCQELEQIYRLCKKPSTHAAAG